MGFFHKLIGADPKSVYKACIKIYEKTKRKNPGKNEEDYLKFVLLTKPPFDYQFDGVVNAILDQHHTIEDLADLIAWYLDPDEERHKQLFASRERNLKFAPEVKERNKLFFKEFWS